MNSANVNLSRRAIINFTAILGDTFVSKPISFVINDEPEDFSNSTLKMQIKKNSRIRKELTTGNGITVNDNAIYFSISASDMEELFIADQYVYDVQKTENGVVTTILAGKINVLNEITR